VTPVSAVPYRARDAFRSCSCRGVRRRPSGIWLRQFGEEAVDECAASHARRQTWGWNPHPRSLRASRPRLEPAIRDLPGGAGQATVLDPRGRSVAESAQRNVPDAVPSRPGPLAGVDRRHLHRAMAATNMCPRPRGWLPSSVAWSQLAGHRSDARCHRALGGPGREYPFDRREAAAVSRVAVGLRGHSRTPAQPSVVRLGAEERDGLRPLLRDDTVLAEPAPKRWH
jgi:hypothetical protein